MGIVTCGHCHHDSGYFPNHAPILAENSLRGGYRCNGCPECKRLGGTTR